MSQADSQASLNRLKQTLTQLQEIVAVLEPTALNDLPADALDTLSTDTEKLIQQLQAENPSLEPSLASPEESSPPPIVASEAQAQEPELTKTATTPTKPPSAPPRRVEPVYKRPRRRSWWQEQKLWIGIATAAIAFIFIWKLTTKAPEINEEIAQSPGTESTEQVTQVAPETEPPTAEAPTAPTATKPKSAPIPSQPNALAKPLTPEQRLIAAIQAQLDEVTQPYGDNIVRTIQADFETSTLRITVGDAWYLLREKLQDRLGTEVLELAQLLDFKKMVVEDLTGNFVAREPVVGDRLVIMRRYQDFHDET